MSKRSEGEDSTMDDPIEIECDRCGALCVNVGDSEYEAVVREDDSEAIRAASHEETTTAVVDYLRYLASTYSGSPSPRAVGARDALYDAAARLEKDWRSALGSRLAAKPKGRKR